MTPSARMLGRPFRRFCTWAFWAGIAWFGISSAPAAESSRILSGIGNRPVSLARMSPEQSGIRFTNRLSPEFASQNQIRMNGSGVTSGDIDGDGRPDLFFCGTETPARLYRNLGGFKFEDATASAGLDFTGRYTTGAVFADLDGDGDMDLIVNSVGATSRRKAMVLASTASTRLGSSTTPRRMPSRAK